MRADEQREKQQQALAEESARRLGEVMEELRQVAESNRADDLLRRREREELEERTKLQLASAL
eukprot:6677661-Alexandrium_andersonii.AAC.1